MAKAAIFDVDGTLVDSVDLHAQAWHDAFRDFGRDIAFDELRAQIGKGGDQLLPVFLDPGEIDEIGERLEAHRAEIFKSRYLSQVTAFPKVRELIRRLIADGTTIALASSAKADELQTYKKVAGIDDLVGVETSSEDAERSKPHPDIFAAAIERLGGIPHGDILAVGDTPWDALAAGKAGLRTVGVLCGGFAEADLREAGCIAIYRDAADLLATYESSPFASGR